MPGAFTRVDDRWGIAYRARMAGRRLHPRLVARFASAYLRGVRHERPIFIVGVPRSGTTTLAELLAGSGELCSPPGESHYVWLAYHHPRRSGWESSAIGPGEVRPGEPRFVNAFFHAYCGSRRFVEKAPANSLRLPHIVELFPDATIVALRRDPCDVINGLIKGWRRPGGRFRSFYVPEELRIPGYAHRRQWCFALVPGWRELIGQPIPEIAFAQWERMSGAIEGSRGIVPESRWIDVCLEDLRERPSETLAELCERLGIASDGGLRGRLEQLNRSPAEATSSPERGKWRRENPEEIGRLLPRIAAAAPARGYRVDPESGAAEPLRGR